MAGGVAVRANLLCVTWSAARGHVFLFDLEAARPVSAWTLPAGSRGYSDAAGVAIDPHFQILVADPHGNRVCHFSAFGRHLGDFGAMAPPVGDAARDRAGVLDRPHAVALLGDTVLVACGDHPRRNGVQRFARDGRSLRSLPCGGDPDAKFGAPRALWVDRDGVLVADTLQGRVQRFRADGAFVSHLTWTPRGVLARPIAVQRDAGGRVLVVDVGDEPGVFAIGAAGERQPVAAIQAECREPIALTADERGRVYVLDHGGERVVRFARDLTYEQVVVDLREHLDEFPLRS